VSREAKPPEAKMEREIEDLQKEFWHFTDFVDFLRK
jgi:hypothetical protein